EAHLRLQGGRVLDRRDRVLLDARVGAPHVRGRNADLPEHLVHARVDGDRRPDRDEDLQLARDALAGEHHARDADAVRDRLPQRVHDRGPLGYLPGGVPRRLASDRHVLRRGPLPLRAVRRLDAGAARRPVVLVAEDLRAVPLRAARQVGVRLHLRRLQPDLLPAAPARAPRDAAADLHVPRRRAVGGVQHGLLDRLVRHGHRLPPRHRRDREERQRAPGGQRSVAGRHARVVHDLSAAAPQLRRGAVRHERKPALRPAAEAGGGADMRTDRAPGPLLIAAVAAAALAAGLVVASAALELGEAHWAATLVALPLLVAVLVAALVSYRRLVAPAAAALGSMLLAIATGGLVAWTDDARWAVGVHVAAAGGALAASLVTLVVSFRGERLPLGPWRDYVTLTKPRIMSLLLVTGAGGMFVGAGGWPGAVELATMLLGLALACGGASALNHVIDRDIDRLMGARTASRPVASGRVPAPRALEF